MRMTVGEHFIQKLVLQQIQVPRAFTFSRVNDFLFKTKMAWFKRTTLPSKACSIGKLFDDPCETDFKFLKFEKMEKVQRNIILLQISNTVHSQKRNEDVFVKNICSRHFNIYNSNFKEKSYKDIKVGNELKIHQTDATEMKALFNRDETSSSDLVNNFKAFRIGTSGSSSIQYSFVSTIYNYSEIQSLYQTCIENHSAKMEDSLRPLQAEALHKLLLGKDLMCILSTNYGKSLIQLLAAFIVAKKTNTRPLCILVYPLSTLMEDSLLRMKRWDLRGMILTEKALQSNEIKDAYDRTRNSNPFYLLCSPESLQLSQARRFFAEQAVSYIIVDEVQTAVDWSKDFRTDFSLIYKLREYIDCPLGIFTATLSNEMIASAIKHTGIQKDKLATVVDIPDRPEIFIQIKKKESEPKDNLRFLVSELNEKKEMADRTLVFVNSIKKTTDLNVDLREMLDDEGRIYRNGKLYQYLSDHFSATTPLSTRRRILSDFSNENGVIRVLFSTISYGMGIDNKTIKRVLIYDYDHNAPSLWQKLGRSGRNGSKSTGIILTRGLKGNKLFQNAPCLRYGILSKFIGAVPYVEKNQNCKCKLKSCACELCECCSLCRAKCICRNEELELNDDDDDSEEESGDEEDNVMENDNDSIIV